MTDVPEFELTVAYDPPELRVVMRGLNNHMLRAILAGFWALLDVRDRTDFIAELAHYDCGYMDELPDLAQFIAALPAPTGTPN